MPWQIQLIDAANLLGCCSMIGPESDAGIIPRFCNDLISQSNSSNDARV